MHNNFIEKTDIYHLDDQDIISVIDTDVQVEICHSKVLNINSPILKLDKKRYVNKKTGEIKHFQTTENRSQSIKTFKRSIKKLRDIINYNCKDFQKMKWATLTYAKNMKDYKKLYKDFKKFIKRLRYQYKDYKIDYIAVAEPQARGAWHMHILLFFDDIAPYIHFSKFAKIWGHGYVDIRRPKNISNFGAYFSVYLTDIELNEFQKNNDVKKSNYDVVTRSNGKKYVKGSRLFRYPAGMRLYRLSKGIKVPKKERMTYKKFKDKYKDDKLKKSFENAIKIKIDEYENEINKKYYKRK